MAKMYLLLKALEILCRMFTSDTFINQARKKPTQFTRRRKLSFAGYMWYLLSNTKRSLTTGLHAFVNEFNEGRDTLSKQAFSQGRQKIRPEAFRMVMDTVSNMFYTEAEYKTWNGMRLTAVDGSKLNIPTSDELAEYFGVQESSGEQVQALSSSLYDVLNGITIDAAIAPFNTNERDLASQHLKYLKEHPLEDGTQELVIFDRGYPSGNLVRVLEEYGFKYVMRFNPTFIPKAKITSADCVIDHTFQAAKYHTTLRVVTVTLDNGQAETLVTNLLDKSLQAEDFRTLYSLRWSIETHYSEVKNKLWLEDFSTKTVEGIQQDFYATLAVSNLVSIQIFDCQDEINIQHNQKESNKYRYKANTNVTIGMLRDSLIRIVVTDSKVKKVRLLKNLNKDVARFVTPVRFGKSSPRHKAHPGAKFSLNNRQS